MPFSLQHAKHVTGKCTNPEHNHVNSTIHMFALVYRGKLVEITLDNGYNVMIDKGLPQINLDYESMVEYVEGETR